MRKDERLGDKFPAHHNVKWGSMEAGESTLSDEWHDMNPSSPKMSEKWVDIEPSKARMSEKYVEIEAGASPDNEWHEMKQERRIDPYSMSPSEGDRPTAFKPMTKESQSNKVERKTQHNEFGSTREI